MKTLIAAIALFLLVSNAFAAEVSWIYVQRTFDRKYFHFYDFIDCAGDSESVQNNNWNQIEAYISEHSEAEFSHGICPGCSKNLYPDIYDDNV